MNFETFGGRKAVMTFLVLVIGTAVELVKPSGISEIFAGFLVFAATGFGLSNALISWKGMEIQSKDQPAASVDLSPIETRLQGIEQQQAAIGNALTQVGQSASNTNKLLIGALNMGKPV